MSGRRRWLVAIVALVVLHYGVRAVGGWIVAGVYPRARHLAGEGRYAEALPLVGRSAVGPHRSAMLWLNGQVRMGIYQDRLLADDVQEEQLDELLDGAFRDYTEAISMSPASGWYWAGLADVYHQRERMERFRYGTPLDLIGERGWPLVGRPGRIAVGMLRRAIEREPMVYPFHDQLAFVLLEYDLQELALASVRRSALAHPRFNEHYYTNWDPIPMPVLDAFAEASRAALGRTPLMGELDHRVALGRVELRRGNYAAAEQDLRQALKLSGTATRRAEAEYDLARALEQLGRYDEALEMLQRAEEHPNLRFAAIRAQARIAEAQGQLELALATLRRARRLAPRDLQVLLDFGRVAWTLGLHRQAEQALRWASRAHPADTRPRAVLLDHLIEMGEFAAARELLEQLERLGMSDAQLAPFRRRVESRGAP